jgi:hypothetical protein
LETGQGEANHETFFIRHLCHAAILASHGVGAVERSDISGFSGAYEQLLPEFERTSGIKVNQDLCFLLFAFLRRGAAQLQCTSRD